MRMDKDILEKIKKFISLYDVSITDSNYRIQYVDIEIAKVYRRYLRKSEYAKSAYIRALIDKLDLVISRLNSFYSDTFNLFNGVNSIVDFICSSIMERHLIDPKLIARFAYIELSKYLYYDISIVKTTDPKIRSIMINTPVDPKETKIFSYVLCVQWLQIYRYILASFGINVKEIRREGEDHIWGEVELPNSEIIIVDGTDYINSCIDLSNAKSVSPTMGFLILPEKYSGLRFQEVYTKPQLKETLLEIKKYYELNRELDVSLGYITDGVYPIEKILQENELFQRQNEIITSPKDASAFITKVQKFMFGLQIPNNMDGYEVFAYYHLLIEKLPMNVRGNISMKTIYTDTFDYKQNRIRRRYLRTDKEYLEYLNELVYSRYYKYLSSPNSDSLFARIKDGSISNEELSSEILAQELKIAEVNRRLNPYYAINELVIYNPFDSNGRDLFQIYEPSVGKKIFYSIDDEENYKKLNKIL